MLYLLHSMLAMELGKEEFYQLFCLMYIWMTYQNVSMVQIQAALGDSIVNNLMYADDLVLLSPYSAGLQQMLMLCFQYGMEHNI